jgi:uncharacterized secreted protein with C-terminal beta-propeller domain
VPATPPTVTVTVLNVSNPAAPSVVEKTVLDGSYDDSRLIGDQLYVVMRNDAWAPKPNVIDNPNYDPTKPQHVPKPKPAVTSTAL